jgi:hypothetical protein
MAISDVVEQDVRPSRLSRRGRRRALVLVAVVALFAGGADWQVRRQEAAGVDRCAGAAFSAVEVAEGRVSITTRYVAPALASVQAADLRRGLLDMVSDAARPSTPRIRRARDLCEAVRVLPIHAEARRIRSDCLRLLDAELSYLTEVAADGERTYEANDAVRGRCVER